MNAQVVKDSLGSCELSRLFGPWRDWELETGIWDCDRLAPSAGKSRHLFNPDAQKEGAVQFHAKCRYALSPESQRSKVTGCFKRPNLAPCAGRTSRADITTRAPSPRMCAPRASLADISDAALWERRLGRPANRQGRLDAVTNALRRARPLFSVEATNHPGPWLQLRSALVGLRQAMSWTTQSLCSVPPASSGALCDMDRVYGVSAIVANANAQQVNLRGKTG
ncbi:hypothetical protein J3458_001916 [Metarhizium acridum]|uniref:uncharacterized protein n=1 Tax=Metarhizium acridum TaxID=92637 RepID=UPI001C6B3650|nr:hypothetical protein J3458_001916 [Metarhizium acridum]